MLIDKLIALDANGVWRADVEAPANEAEFYANTYKWDESTQEWVNLTSSDVTWAQLDIEQVKADTAMEVIRIERNQKLKNTDWSQGADVPDSHIQHIVKSLEICQQIIHQQLLSIIK